MCAWCLCAVRACLILHLTLILCIFCVGTETLHLLTISMYRGFYELIVVLSMSSTWREKFKTKISWFCGVSFFIRNDVNFFLFFIAKEFRKNAWVCDFVFVWFFFFFLLYLLKCISM